MSVGLSDGELDGLAVGKGDGAGEGGLVGPAVGLLDTVGDTVGPRVGGFDGTSDGDEVGHPLQVASHSVLMRVPSYSSSHQSAIRIAVLDGFKVNHAQSRSVSMLLYG